MFIIEEDTTGERLIYDFSRPEEFVTLTYNDYRFVRTDGDHLFHFLPGQLWYAVCKFTEDGEVDYSNDISGWIDGAGDLGSNPFAFEYAFLPLDVYKLGKRIGVRTCMKDGKYIYNMAWMTMPVPSSIENSSYVDNIEKVYHLYDLTGRRLITPPSHGVYIQNGRKYVR